MSEQLESALALAAAGYRVFPATYAVDGHCSCGKDCGKPEEHPTGKHPAILKWQKLATTDEEQIRKWWQRRNYNPAIATGKGLVVLDVDTRHGGLESLKELEAKHGKLPETRKVVTGGSGWHYYFHTEKKFTNRAGKLGKGLDVRSDGALVIAPGAVHISGRCYEWELLCSPEDGQEEAALPDWLEKLMLGGGVEENNQTEWEDWEKAGTPITKGQRNDKLFEYGCFLRGQRGYTARRIEKALLKKNSEQCVPPLPEDEVKSIVDSVESRYQPKGAPAEVFGAVGLKSFADVPAEEPRYLIKPYLPEGALTILQGNPGDGKTALACKLAAAVSTGAGLLDSPCEAGSVIVLSVEDDAPILRGRLKANGANLEKCFLPEEAHTLNFLSPEVELYVKEKAARLIIFDPVQAFLGAGMDMNKSNETRPVLAALSAMARRNHCGVILISHLNKAGARDGAAIHRSLGSTDIPAAARSVIHIGRNAQNLEQRVLVHVKSSTARTGSSIAFDIVEHGGVQLAGYTRLGYDDLANVGKKTRQAAQGFQAEEVIAACRKVLDEHPNGAKIGYSELGIVWPEGVRPRNLLEALTSRLEDEGIVITTGERLSNGRNAVIISRAASGLEEF